MKELICIKKTGGKNSATINLPSSKSITNRAYIINALSGGAINIINASKAEDSETLKSLLTSEISKFDVGHAGTAMRFLTALFSITKGERILTGSDRMKQRPIKDLAEALIALGASIKYLEKEGYPPLKINGKHISGGKINIDASVSSQFISAIMLIAPYLKNGLTINLEKEKISIPYIEMTLEMIKKSGAEAMRKGNTIIIEPGKYRPFELIIEPDWSAASYWYSYVALSENSEIILKGLSTKSLQGDVIVHEIFEKLGVETVQIKEGIVLKKSRNKSPEEFNFNFSNCPDIAQTVAVSMAALAIKGTLSGLKSLRIKETDRIEAICAELKKFGVQAISGPDFIQIPAGKICKPAVAIETYEDHRMAMAFAPLAMVIGEFKLKNPGVVKKSYPDFWKDMESAGMKITIH